MSRVRKNFYGRCVDICRALGRSSLFLPKFFDRLGDWFAERAR